MSRGLLLRTAKNFLAGGIGQVIGATFLFIANIFIARKLGPSEFGTWSFLLNVGMLVWMIIENLITPVYLKKLKDFSKVTYLWKQLLGYCLFLGVLGYFTFFISILALKQSLFKLSLIMGTSIIFLLLATACNTVFRASEKQEFLAFSFIIHKIVVFSLVFYSKDKLSLLAVALIFLVSDFLYFFLNMIIIKFFFNLPVEISFTFKRFLSDLKKGATFSFAQILRRLAFQIELLLGYFLVGAYQTGLFAVGVRVLQVVFQTAQMSSVALFVFLNKKQNYIYKLSNFSKLINILFCLGIVGGILNYIFAPIVIGLFGPKYIGSLSILKSFSVVFPFLLLSTFFYYLFAATKMEKMWLKLQILFFSLTFLISYSLLKSFELKGMIFSKIFNEIFLTILASSIIIQKIKNKNNSQKVI